MCFPLPHLVVYFSLFAHVSYFGDVRQSLSVVGLPVSHLGGARAAVQLATMNLWTYALHVNRLLVYCGQDTHTTFTSPKRPSYKTVPTTMATCHQDHTCFENLTTFDPWKWMGHTNTAVLFPLLNRTKKCILTFDHRHRFLVQLSVMSGNCARGILSEASNSMLLCITLGGVTVCFLDQTALLAASVWEDSVPELWG